MIGDDQRRMVSIIGHGKEHKLRYFQRDEIENFDRVFVDISNPTTDTIAGKMWLAEQLIQRGLISTPQEFLTVAQVGQLEPVLHADDMQLSRIHAENDRLSRGMPARALHHSDNHVLDIKEHSALLSEPDVREDEKAVSVIGAHIMEHYQALMQPDVQLSMLLLGFPVPPMMGALGTGAPNEPNAPKNGAGSNKQAPKALSMPGEPPKGGPGGAMGRMPNAVT
jgi:hypothetical protein